MNSGYNDVIKKAMDDYFSNTNNQYDNEELKLFAKTLDDAENSINIEQFEKIKKLVRNLT